MSIFENKDWTREDILEVFGSKKELIDVYTLSLYSSNGEYMYKGTYYQYFELSQLIEILSTW